MNKIREEMEKSALQMQKIEKFVSLSLRRENIANDVLPLSNEIERVRQQMLAINHRLKNEFGIMEAEHEQLMRRMRKQQLCILEYLTEQKKQKLEEENNAVVEQLSYLGSACKPVGNKAQLLPQHGSAIKGLGASMTNLKLQTHTPQIGTPRMSVKDYMASPLVKRSRLQPMQLSFVDFEVGNISAQVFETIPKYMRAGREGVEELNNFLQSVIVPCFNDKYLLLHRQRAAIRGRQDMDLWQLYQSQASYVPGKHFITPGDITRKMDKMLDKKTQNRITMLRHVGILQEQRVSGTVCYIWSAKTK